MRTLIASAVLLAAAPSASAATIIGSVDGGPTRILDANLKAVPGTPALPAGIEGTVLSPNGKRVAAWSVRDRRLTVHSRKTFGVQERLRIPLAIDVFWPSRHHIVITAVDSNANRSIVRSYDLKRDTARTWRFGGSISDVELAGRRLRLVRQSEGEPGFQRGDHIVTELGAGGETKLSWKVPAPPTARMDIEDGLLMVSHDADHWLIPVGGEPHGIELPAGHYGWTGHDFVYGNGRIARIDRSAPAVAKTIDIGITETPTPYRGGLVIGFGRERYDANLERVAQNPDPARVAGTMIIAGDRLYASVFDCGDNPAVAIADARTGKAIRRVPGKRRYGVLGGGYLPSTNLADECD